VVAVTPDDVASVTDELDLGERAAIALAIRIHADFLLIDETAGRAEAKRRSLRVTGTLGVLRAAAEAGLLNVQEVVTRLGSTNFYVDEVLITKIFGRWLGE
jgi:Predicted nucleic acid-binding protein, contains PIN domain